jgi:hypothetical protein
VQALWLLEDVGAEMTLPPDWRAEDAALSDALATQEQRWLERSESVIDQVLQRIEARITPEYISDLIERAAPRRQSAPHVGLQSALRAQGF